jgi:hypothetical protein
MLKFCVAIRTLVVEIRTDDTCEFCDESCPRMFTKASNFKDSFYCNLEVFNRAKLLERSKEGIPIRCPLCKEKLKEIKMEN